MTAFTLRRVRAGDGPAIRKVRLRALETDPASFGSTYQREAAFSPADWEEWAAAHAAGDQTATLLALRGDEPLGIVGAYREPGDVFHVFSMWVAPEVRREGVGRMLLGGVETWIAACGGSRIRLSVTDEAAAARRLYESAGYEPDGRRDDSPHTPGVVHVGLAKPVSAGRS